MPPAQPSIDSTASALPLWIACGAGTAIVIALIAAWLIHGIARDALAKADPKDIPEVLTALGGILERYQNLIPRRRSYFPQRQQLTDDVTVSRSARKGGE